MKSTNRWLSVLRMILAALVTVVVVVVALGIIINRAKKPDNFVAKFQGKCGNYDVAISSFFRGDQVIALNYMTDPRAEQRRCEFEEIYDRITQADFQGKLPDSSVKFCPSMISGSCEMPSGACRSMYVEWLQGKITYSFVRIGRFSRNDWEITTNDELGLFTPTPDQVQAFEKQMILAIHEVCTRENLVSVVN
jgi:hypothetical protein